MADSEWIGKRFVARCAMNLPDQGEKRPGDEFTFTAACARLGLRPESWLEVGNAELVGKAKSKPGPSPDVKPPDAKPSTPPSEKPKAADAGDASPAATFGRKKGGDD